MGISSNAYTIKDESAHPIPRATLLIDLDEEFAQQLAFDNSGFYLLDPTATALGGPGGMVRDSYIQQFAGTSQKLAVSQVPGGLAATMKAERVCLFPCLCFSAADGKCSLSGHLRNRTSPPKEEHSNSRVHTFFNGSFVNMDHTNGRRSCPTTMEVVTGPDDDLRPNQPSFSHIGRAWLLFPGDDQT